MTEISPMTPWKRFLALPIDSRPKTLLVAGMTAALSASVAPAPAHIT